MSKRETERRFSELVKDLKPPKPRQARESVRTTFNLTDACGESLDWLTAHFGGTQKEAISISTELLPTIESLLTIPGGADFDFYQNPRQKKSLVLDGNTLQQLKETAKKTKATTTEVFELLIILTRRFIENIEKARIEGHKRLKTQVDALWEQAEEIEKGFQGELNEDDPAMNRLQLIICTIMNLSSALEAERERGVPIVADDMAQSC